MTKPPAPAHEPDDRPKTGALPGLVLQARADGLHLGISDGGKVYGQRWKIERSRSRAWIRTRCRKKEPARKSSLRAGALDKRPLPLIPISASVEDVKATGIQICSQSTLPSIVLVALFVPHLGHCLPESQVILYILACPRNS